MCEVCTLKKGAIDEVIEINVVTPYGFYPERFWKRNGSSSEVKKEKE